jgi:hypothetical protein
MWREFWIGAATVMTILASLVWVSTQVTFLFHHPRTKDQRVEIDKRTGAAVVMKEAKADSDPQPADTLPRAEVPETDFNFGMMDPLATGRHSFVIHNRGKSTLKLHEGPTTCTCTFSGLANKEVAPGESTQATLEWNSRTFPQFAQSAAIYTNDPALRTIELRVRGEVRMLIGCDVPEIELEGIEPDHPAVIERIVYSQIWDSVAIQNVESRIAGLKWEATDVEASALSPLEAKAAQRLRLTIPGDLPSGRLTDSLRVHVKRNGSDNDIHSVDLPLQARVLKRLAIYGAGIDQQGVIDLGNIPEGKEKRVQLLAKVRDPQHELGATKIETYPQCLRAEFVAHDGEQSGLYDLRVMVPDDAPVGQFQSNPIGRIRIQTGHPRIGTVELRVAFVVAPRPSL